MASKLQRISLVLVAAALLCWILESVVYSGIDANGVLEESFFLPLGYILAVTGLCGIGLCWIISRRQ